MLVASRSQGAKDEAWAEKESGKLRGELGQAWVEDTFTSCRVSRSSRGQKAQMMVGRTPREQVVVGL